ncbi:cytokine-inducible SH2-containing protein-like [Denticeps clupeoides]|uniref:Suppressor of cytokine signaling 2 n=1 Tax=Denticeps clupeoides TaxID=299321 RepID=A0AAY4CD19_9TELE|nr:cytokine-inducible SH2-containing protein-like [Denticeps clupeoides]XP_028849668.1 cytokine-inducible SH2-containing protein-like [Denticeps clupeoides]
MITPLPAPPEKPAAAVSGRKEPGLEPRPAEDGEGLREALSHLTESGWYWGPITAAEAKQLLSESLEGTFLLRDSSNPGYLLTLSVKTSLGPTHLRIRYADGKFGFDSVVMARPHLRQFRGAVELVQHYTLAHQRVASRKELPPVPEVEDSVVPVVPETTLLLKLTKPLHRSAPSLQHLCRKAINQHSHSLQDLPLPDRLKDFLLEYPFML